METTTSPRTLADVYRERLEAADPSDKLMTAINDAIGTMAPYTGDEIDLRRSEREWLDGVAHDAGQAAHAAVLEAVIEVYRRELPRLLPSHDDPAVPVHLWEQGSDELSDDAELAAAAE